MRLFAGYREWPSSYDCNITNHNMTHSSGKTNKHINIATGNDDNPGLSSGDIQLDGIK